MQIMHSLRQVPLLSSIVRTTRSLHSRAIDRRLRIDTCMAGLEPAAALSRFNDHREYEPMNYSCIRAFFNALQITPEDVVYDIGCGKGRLLCVAARMGVRRCVGIEVCDDLAQAAMCNARTMRPPKSSIEIRATDAATEDYSDGTVYCLFNPFGEQTLRSVLQRIHRTLVDNPRRIRIGYASPNHDHVLRTARWLRQYAVLRFRTHRYPIHFWDNQLVWEPSIYVG